MIFPSKTLTNNTTTDILSVSLPSSLQSAMLNVQTCTSVSNGTDVQTRIDDVIFLAINKSGTLTTLALNVTVGVPFLDTQTIPGTLISTFTSTISGTNAILQLNSNSSLTSISTQNVTISAESPLINNISITAL